MPLFNLANRVTGLFVSAIVAVCFLGFGVAMVAFVGPSQAREAAQISKLTELDAAGLQAAAPDQKVLISGVLQENPTLIPEGLVAYARERWEVERDSDGDTDGSWRQMEKIVPELTVDLDGGQVQMAGAPSATLGGDQTSTVVERTNSSMTDNGLPDGSIRVIGFRNGDLVTIVGAKTSTGTLVPSRIYGGEQAELVKELKTGAKLFSLCGIGMIIVVPFIVFGGLFGRVRAALRR